LAKHPLNPPRKQRTREHVLADLSANHVEKFALHCGFAVERLSQDYGLDLAVFTFDEQGYRESGVIWMQLKATDHVKTTRDGKAVLITGSPGSRTIINTVLQVVVNVVDYDMNLQQAIDAPRFHHQWLPDETAWEAFEFPKDTWDALAAKGHAFKETPANIGDAHAIMIDADGTRLGASDPRRGGVPVGW